MVNIVGKCTVKCVKNGSQQNVILLMDAQLNVVHNKMSTGCTVKCDPGMMEIF